PRRGQERRFLLRRAFPHHPAHARRARAARAYASAGQIFRLSLALTAIVRLGRHGVYAGAPFLYSSLRRKGAGMSAQESVEEKYQAICFVSSTAPDAEAARLKLVGRYG